MTTSADIRIPPATGSAPRGGQRPDEACARHVDGLFTYCLSVLCDHDAALAAVRSVRDLAVRHHGRLRDPSLQRAWLYSLARYACLLRLEDAAAPGRPDPDADAAPPPPPPGQQEERRRRLALLAWPEAAGTTPQQREALELAMRHGLAPAEVAAVLGLLPEEASALLVRAGAEVARTRTALRVLAAAECPELDLLGGGRTAGGHGGMLLVPALRRELVRHVDDCPTCRGTAGREAPGDAWPGTGLLHGGTGAGVSLPLVDAPVAALAGTAGAAFLAGASAGRRARAARRGPAPAPGPARGRVHRAPAPAADPRFDRQGFPRHRADSPDLAAALRNRAVTTTVLAAVLAAPVAALWVAHRGGDGAGGPAAVSSVRVDTVGATPAGGPATAGPSPAAGAGPVDRETARRFGPLASRSGPVPQAAGAPAPLPQATAQAPGRAAVPVALRVPAGPPAAGPAAAG
ncbi:sigma-70 family RNA polymerase sigma factor, partial [Streptacidiphilus sp. ASG 303]|uniref:sigma-70 family RNA polymerase sigma factor n=1 Tax=Streptacidiphilus sp. ASG 303 TaxID=2896847 RepID=UPI001E4C624C